MPELELTTYKPNLSDPRVQKRIDGVLAWCDLHLSTTSPEQVHHNELIKIFGPSGNSLSKWLRANLLTQTGVYQPGLKSYSYLLIERGVDKLRAHASKHMVNTSPTAPVEIHPELESLTFDYTLKSDRYWHPLQNIKRDKKEVFWRSHLPFNYDIEAAAPTILFQLSKRPGRHGTRGMPAILGTYIEDYLANKAAWRQHVADLTGCSLIDAKRLLNALFNGARLARNEHCSAYRLLGCSITAMTRLQNDHKVRMLRSNIKTMWMFIGYSFTVKGSKDKWRIYFMYERKVLDVIKAELERAGIKHFTEHDGFRTGREIDVEAIQSAVQQQTRLDIKLNRS